MAFAGKILRCAQDDKSGGDKGGGGEGEDGEGGDGEGGDGKRGDGKGGGDKGGDGEVSTVVGAHRSVFRSLPGGVIARGTPRRCGGRVFRQSRH